MSTATKDKAIEGSAREAEPSGGEVVRHQPAAPAAPTDSRTLWGTDDPAEVVNRATRVANALAPVLKQRKMLQRIGDRDHVKIEGWQTLGSMVGVVAVHPWVRELPWPDDAKLTDALRKVRDSGYVFGYEAGYTATTLAGAPVGGGEGACKRTEEQWFKRYSRKTRKQEVVDDFALKGMAQTRAQSRCLASPLRFIVELAGFAGTPAEDAEGQVEGSRATGTSKRPARRAPQAQAESKGSGGKLATLPQRKKIFAEFKKHGGTVEEELRALIKWVADVEHTDRIPASKVDGVLAAVREREATIAAIHDAAADPDRPDGPEARAVVDKFLSEAKSEKPKKRTTRKSAPKGQAK